MDRQDLQFLWNILAGMDATLLADPRGPLIHLNGSEACFGLPALPELPFNPSAQLLSRVKPSFKNLEMDNLAFLRGNLYTGMDSRITADWAEALLRFCEIQAPALKKKALEKWPEPASARLGFLQIAAFLLDYHFHSGDLRFLNTVLKLCDLTWILRAGTLRKSLRRSGPGWVAASFQVRLLLMTEYALEVSKRS